MTLKVITSPPDPSSWTTLAEHQASTPATFNVEVLHFQTDAAKLTLASDQKLLLPAFFPEATNDVSIPEIETVAEGDAEREGGDEDWEDEDEPELIQDVTLNDLLIYVTSKNLIIYSTSLKTGYEISYPAITLHAITSTPTTSGIYLQINISESTFDDHDYSSLEVTIYPPQTNVTTSSLSSITGSTQQMFEALSNCSNLHPDPDTGFFSNGAGDGADDEDWEDETGDNVIWLDSGDRAGGTGITFLGGADEVGGIPALAPGGWITAENVDRIRWTIDGQSGTGDPNNASLGPGAGSVRRRDEVEDPVDGGAEPNGNGEGGDGADIKWRRTD